MGSIADGKLIMKSISSSRLGLLTIVLAMLGVTRANSQPVSTNAAPAITVNFAERYSPGFAAGMTPEQRAQFKAALQRMSRASLECYASQTNGVAVQVRQEKLQQAAQNFDKEIRAILSPEQYAKFKDLQGRGMNRRASEVRQAVIQKSIKP
jgi:Spy/CpxP family protein refolding chaperone